MSNQNPESMQQPDPETQDFEGDHELEAANSSGEPERTSSADGRNENSADDRSSEELVIEAKQEALRARAEMENFRKRMQRDLEQQVKYANLPLMKDLLEVLDNLQRALDAANSDDPATQGLRDGVAMVSRQMTDVLAKYGCHKIEAMGLPFDPNVHEAISQMPSDDYQAGHVMHEAAEGYQLHDRVVRPSHVVVSSGNSQQSE
jgi:molecular chaperone GrpE